MIMEEATHHAIHDHFKPSEFDEIINREATSEEQEKNYKQLCWGVIPYKE